MTDAVRRRALTRARVIRVQWLIILVLAVALIVSLATRPRAVSQETVEPPPVTTPVPEVSEPAVEEQETPAPIELGEFKTTAYCTCVKCCGIWSQDHPSRVGTDYVQKRQAARFLPRAGR